MTRSPAEVPLTFIRSASEIDSLARLLQGAVAVAIDTETVYKESLADDAGPLRVMSVATRDRHGVEAAVVVDRRDFDVAVLAPLLDGVQASAWNASFDARVLDRAVFEPAGYGRHRGIRWWDAQLADALLHQGVTGFNWFHGLAWATERYLGLAAQGKGTVQLSYDATSELTEEQIAYAGADAVETLWVTDELRRLITEAGLDTVAGLEMEARPFLDHLQRCGLGFDREGYAAHLDDRRVALGRCLTHLAELTGGGQGNLFSVEVEPAWNPASEPQAKAALNRHAAEQVAAYTARSGGQPRALVDTDHLTAMTLSDIGGPIAETLLEFRSHAKLLSAYGENLTPFLGADGRFHSQYLQVVGVNTGRLSTRYPNVQTFPPDLKPYVRPTVAGRVYVHADVSQAELRWLAQVSGDDALREAFREGADVHLHTAARMFGVDVDALEPSRRAELRARAKTINFGIVYGQGARALAASLSRAGVETSIEDGQRLLASYLAAYPQVAAWVSGQDRQVDSLAKAPPPVDWPASLRLYDEFGPLSLFRRAFRDENRRWPDASEIEEARGEQGLWAASFEEAMVLGADGEPFEWQSRTLAGRRRRFTVSMGGILRRVALATAGSPDPALRAILQRLGLPLLSGPALEKLLEDRLLRRSVVAGLLDEVGWEGSAALWRSALADGVRIMVNAHRNAPIQGGVADAMLAAYAELWQRLAPHNDLWPVLTVHDSIVVECPAERASEVAMMIEDAIVAGFGRFCTEVSVGVDIDVRPSLASPSKVG